MSASMSASRADSDVVVVGAGIVGAVTALGCAQLGLKVALIGPVPPATTAPSDARTSGARTDARTDAPTSDARTFDARIYALAPATVALLQRLKVWPQIDASRMQAVARMRVFGDAGRELTLDAYAAAVERLATIGEEAELARVLRTACAYAPGLERIEAGFAGLHVDADGRAPARVRLDDGRELAAKLVIAADGANSAVRAAAGINADEKSYAQTAVVANFGCAATHQGTAWQWFTEQGVVALLPLAEGVAGPAVSLVWSAPTALATELLALEPEALAERVAARVGMVAAGAVPAGAHAASSPTAAAHGGAASVASAASATSPPFGPLRPLGAARGFPLRRIRVDRLVFPRLALVGDAAHVIHPLAGQGLNLGIADVSELLQVLGQRESFRDIGDLVLLRRYARARAEAIGLMRLATDGLAQLFGIDDPWVRRVRNTGLSVVNAVAPIKRALIRHALG